MVGAMNEQIIKEQEELKVWLNTVGEYHLWLRY